MKAEELQLRQQKICLFLKQANIDACLISTNVNLLYTTGRIISGYYYLDINGNNLILVKRPIGIEGNNVVYFHKIEQIKDILIEKQFPIPSVLLLESEEMQQSEWARISQVFASSKIINGSNLLRKVRSVKTPYEISLLKKSGEKHTLCYKSIPELYRTGMTDIELSIEIERLMRLNGNLGLFRTYGNSMEIYFGSLLAGENATIPSPFDFALGGAGPDSSLPIGANGTSLSEGMSVMIDMCGNFTGYISDQTRTFSIKKLCDKGYRAHQVALEIQSEIVNMAKPGISGESLYKKAIEIVRKYQLEDYFMGIKQQAKFVGHGVGLVINEYPILAPRSTDPLEEGMVFALEPKFVLDTIGAVGIENTFVVTSSGVEKITLAEERIINIEDGLPIN